ncbi:MAG: sulfur oxidation c-type cytochrome SoxX [Rhodospirillaceae bacterium]
MKIRALAYCALGAAVVLTAGVAVAAGHAKMGDKKEMKTIEYKVVDKSSIPASLTGKPGDPANGKKVVIDRKKGNCLACHVMPIPEQAYHGNIGPELNGVGKRYSAGELRLRIVNPKVINSETIMPAFYKNDGFHRVLKKFKGKTIISAQDVEDVVAYLMTLK